MIRDERINKLLNGAIDLHIHADPSFMIRSVDALEAAEECLAAGMRAISVKDHFVSTGISAYFANKYMHKGDHEFTVYGSICLNSEYEFNLHAIDTAMKFGAKQVYLPTVSSRSHKALTSAGGAKKAGDSHFIPQKIKAMKPDEIYCIDESGRLKEEVKAVLQLVKEYDAILQTGHIGYDEAYEVVRYCREIGLEKVVLTHFPTFTTLDMDKLKAIVDMGGYVDINESQIVDETPAAVRNTRQELIGYIRVFTPERCIITTDSGSILFPRPAAAMRTALGVYIDAGFTDEELTLMVKTNPAKLLGLEI